MPYPCRTHAVPMPCPCRAHAVPVGQQAKQLVEALMRKDAGRRLTIEQMLQHPWLLHEGRPSGLGGDPTPTPTRPGPQPHPNPNPNPNPNPDPNPDPDPNQRGAGRAAARCSSAGGMGSMVLDLAWWTRGDTGPSEQESERPVRAQLRATSRDASAAGRAARLTLTLTPTPT